MIEVNKNAGIKEIIEFSDGLTAINKQNISKIHAMIDSVELGLATGLLIGDVKPEEVKSMKTGYVIDTANKLVEFYLEMIKPTDDPN